MPDAPINGRAGFGDEQPPEITRRGATADIALRTMMFSLIVARESERGLESAAGPRSGSRAGGSRGRARRARDGGGYSLGLSPGSFLQAVLLLDLPPSREELDQVLDGIALGVIEEVMGPRLTPELVHSPMVDRSFLARFLACDVPEVVRQWMLALLPGAMTSIERSEERDRWFRAAASLVSGEPWRERGSCTSSRPAWSARCGRHRTRAPRAGASPRP